MNNLFAIAADFRRMIELARENRLFPVKDRMAGFPRGCCDDASDLFANHLWQFYQQRSVRVDGAYYADQINKRCWHTWLEVDNIIVDLTADYYCSKYKSLYVGPTDAFHEKFETERMKYIGFLSLSQNCWARMQQCYDIIISCQQLA